MCTMYMTYAKSTTTPTAFLGGVFLYPKQPRKEVLPMIVFR